MLRGDSWLQARGFPVGASVWVQAMSAKVYLTRLPRDMGFGVILVHDEMRPEERLIHKALDPWWANLYGMFKETGEIAMSLVDPYSEEMINMVRRLYDMAPVKIAPTRELPFGFIKGKIGIRPGDRGELATQGEAAWWPNKGMTYATITLQTSDQREIIKLS